MYKPSGLACLLLNCISCVEPSLQSTIHFPTAVLMDPELANPSWAMWAHVNPDRHRAVTAHGYIMGFAFAILFPLGAILIRTASFRGLVVRHFFVFFPSVRDCFSNLETYCRSTAALSGFIRPDDENADPIQRTSGRMQRSNALPTSWLW